MATDSRFRDKPLKDFKSPLPMIYACLLNDVREICRDHGYCVAVHGSLSRDFDVALIPWARTVSTAEEVVAALCSKIRHLMYDEDPAPVMELKPWGRKAWSISLGHGAVLDVSVLPAHAQYSSTFGDDRIF